MRRFYRQAAAGPAPDGSAAQVVLLDGKPLTTPDKHLLRLPNPALAQAVAAEWQGQGETLRPLEMYLTQLAATAQDRVPGRFEAVVAEVAAYGGSDLLCYRAERPETLVAQQQEQWQPLLDWFCRSHDAPLRVTRGIMPLAQPAEALRAVHAAVAGLDAWRLTALQTATGLFGSLVLGMALVRGHLSAEAACRAAWLDELFQESSWGHDAEAAARRDLIRAEIDAAARFCALLD